MCLTVGRFVCSQEAGRHDNHPIQGSDKPGVCDCLCTVYVTVPLHDNVSLPSSPPHPPPLTPLPSFPSLIPLIPQYASVEQLFEDLNLLFDSTCLAYPKESPLYKVSCAAGLIPPLQASNPLLPSSLTHTHTHTHTGCYSFASSGSEEVSTADW